ncbi:GDSL-type esterase/lipase family protein [Pedobacter sp. P351]|uniref:GDSL-type esterase/lipase family protein n=1 Tax=Pedobacter superstes TaxID=3133441 RepID=UPI0030AC105E
MKNLIVCFAFYIIAFTASAQTQANFWDDVQTIKKIDKIYKAPEHPVLFTGSSSIRKWDNLNLVFPKYNVLNRGIGGAIINDIIYYLDDLVFAYQPSQIVLYVGENDLPSASADTILSRTRLLYNKIRTKLPSVPLVYISIKPSPVRAQFVQKAAEANRLIKTFLAADKNVKFVDVYSAMLTKEGKTRPELFVGDMLHMNKKGYELWRKALKPYLLKP